MLIKKVDRNTMSVAPINYSLSLLERLALKHELDNQEISQIISALALSRYYSAEVALGVADYTDWSHLKSENGYSIWKCAVSNFSDSTNNLLWNIIRTGLENIATPQMLSYMGAADAETGDYFDFLYAYDGSLFSSNYGGSGGDLSSEGGSYQTVLEDTDDFFYVDMTNAEGIYFQFKVFAAGMTLKVEYYDSAAWTALSAINSLTDTTNNFTSNGKLSFSTPNDMSSITINGQTKPWVRISTTTDLSRNPSCYYVAPLNSVPTLLVRSTKQIINQEFAWCYFNNYVYVTIPNTGNADYEGDIWIASSSTAANLENFFQINCKFYTRYKLNTWPTVTANRRGTETFNGVTGVAITHSLGHTNYTVSITPHGTTALPVSIVKANNDVTVYTSAGITSDFDFAIIEG